MQAVGVQRLVHAACSRHLHHDLLSDVYLQVAGQGVVDAHIPVTDDAFLAQHPESGNRRMPAQVHLACRCEVAHRELGRAVLLNKGRLAVAQFGRHLQHQFVARERTVHPQ